MKVNVFHRYKNLSFQKGMYFMKKSMKKFISLLIVLSMIMSIPVITHAQTVLNETFSLLGSNEDGTLGARMCSIDTYKTGDKTYAYIAALPGSSSYGMYAVDITDPAAIKVIQSISKDDYNTQLFNAQLFVHGDYVFAVNAAKGQLNKYPIITSGENQGMLDTANVSAVQTLSQSRGYLAVKDEYLFIGTQGDQAKMTVYDISTPSNPKKLGETSDKFGNYALEIEKLSDGSYRAYYIKRNGSDWRFAITDIAISGSNVTFTDRFDDSSASVKINSKHANSDVRDITLIGKNKVAVAGTSYYTEDNVRKYNPLEIIDATDPTAPVLTQTDVASNALYRVMPLGDKILVATDNKQKLYTLNNDNTLAYVLTVDNTINASFVDSALHDGKLISVAEGKLNIYDAYTEFDIDSDITLYDGSYVTIGGSIKGAKSGDVVSVEVDNKQYEAQISGIRWSASVTASGSGTRTITATLTRNGTVIATETAPASVSEFNSDSDNVKTTLTGLISTYTDPGASTGHTSFGSSNRLTSSAVKELTIGGEKKYYAYTQSWGSYYVFDVTDSNNISIVQEYTPDDNTYDSSNRPYGPGREYYGDRLSIVDNTLYAAEVTSKGVYKYTIGDDGKLDTDSKAKAINVDSGKVVYIKTIDNLLFTIFDDSQGLAVYNLSDSAKIGEIKVAQRAVAMDICKTDAGKYTVAVLARDDNTSSKIIIAEFDAADGILTEKYNAVPNSLAPIDKNCGDICIVGDKVAVTYNDYNNRVGYTVIYKMSESGNKTELTETHNISGTQASTNANIDGSIMVATQNESIYIAQYDAESGAEISKVTGVSSRGNISRIDDSRLLLTSEGYIAVVGIDMAKIVLNASTDINSTVVRGKVTGMKSGDKVKIKLNSHSIYVTPDSDGNFEYDLGSSVVPGRTYALTAVLERNGADYISDAKEVVYAYGKVGFISAEYENGVLTTGVRSYSYSGSIMILAGVYNADGSVKTMKTAAVDTKTIGTGETVTSDLSLNVETGDTVILYIWNPESLEPLCLPYTPEVAVATSSNF